MFAVGEDSAAQAVVGSIAWTLRLLKKLRKSREMNTRSYAFIWCAPNYPILSFINMETFYILFSANDESCEDRIIRTQRRHGHTQALFRGMKVRSLHQIGR